jgi:hypothetical protein
MRVRAITEAILRGAEIRRALAEEVDLLDSGEYVGTRGEIDKTLKTWSEQVAVELHVMPAWKVFPRRVWYGAIPRGVRERYEEAIDSHFEDDSYNKPSEMFMVVYESPEAARRFRMAAPTHLRQIVIDSIKIDCPLDYDLYVPITDKSREAPPRVPRVPAK